MNHCITLEGEFKCMEENMSLPSEFYTPEASSFQVSCSCISLFLEEVTHDLLFPTQAVQAHSRHEHRDFQSQELNERKISLSCLWTDIYNSFLEL